MPHPLVDRLRAQRQHKLPIGAHVFHVLRPTQIQLASLRGAMDGDLVAKAAAVLQYVTGWESVTEMDIIAGGAAHPVPFDAGLLNEWLQDRVDLLVPLLNALVELVTAHTSASEQDAKKSPGGSSG